MKAQRLFLWVGLLAFGLLAYLTGKVKRVGGFDLAVLLALFGGYPIFWSSLRELLRRRISADLAVALAALAALYMGEYVAAAEVVIIMLLGEALEELAVGSFRRPAPPRPRQGA